MKHIHPKKFLGQHFLTDLNTASLIADTVDACPNLPILEVGPGTGVLTQFLLKKNRPLKVVEIDYESTSYLLHTFPMLENNIIEDDFLTLRLDKIFHNNTFVLTGNYPYNISSQILFKMLDYKHLIPCCTGMIQKEVAERITSKPGNKHYGILSVLLQCHYNAEYLFTVEPNVFNPPPKVRSAVIRLTHNGTTQLGCNEQLFKRVVKTAFNQRRKQLHNALLPLLSDADNALRRNNLVPHDHQKFLSNKTLTLRPEQLSVHQFITLTNEVEKEIQAQS